jgi:hypothetical protein
VDVLNCVDSDDGAIGAIVTHLERSLPLVPQISCACVHALLLTGASAVGAAAVAMVMVVVVVVVVVVLVVVVVMIVWISQP